MRQTKAEQHPRKVETEINRTDDRDKETGDRKNTNEVDKHD